MAVKKLKRGVLSSKPQQKYVHSTIHISPSTPIPTALKRVDRKLGNGKVRVLGMGRAIQSVLQVAAALKSQKYTVEIRTLTLTAIDETVDEVKGKSTMAERPVPAMELMVLPSKLG